jgi:hypothetical protein
VKNLVPLVLFVVACGPGQITGSRDTGLDGLAVTRIDPGLVLPGTRVVVAGHSFVDSTLGATRLRLAGSLRGGALDIGLDVTYVNGGVLQIEVNDGVVAAFGGLSGTFTGTATVEVESTVDHRVHASAPLTLKLDLATDSTPTFDAVGDGLSFVNQPVQVSGKGFLLGGAEGETRARLSGCFTPTNLTTCGPQVVQEIPATPEGAFDRTRVTFPYITAISGIGSGRFVGMLRLVNVHRSGVEKSSAARPVDFDIQKPAIFSASTTAASLGQYVVINGGGFAGGANEVTLLTMQGNFTPTVGKTRAIDVQLVPEFVSGPQLRYVLSDQDDPLGQVIDLRRESGTILATVKPVVLKGITRAEGVPVTVKLDILPVKQVVHVNFLPSFVGSLRKFGLRAADPLIRARVLAIAARDYAGSNVEFRDAQPQDFALYAEVDIAGPDPNGLGLLGYDNSPGKDTENARLYDKIGGVNATTQQDGYPGFGGVFTESFFGFSQHPNGIAMVLPQSNKQFDQIFDPFRPDQGGLELTASELAALAPPVLTDGNACPASGDDRAQRIACAIFVLGNLIGTTMTHEVGHSLGLANPYGEGFHNFGDAANRLMDSGGDRPFDERAELGGTGPARFCTDEFDYLRSILPSKMPPPATVRPSCD